MLGADLAFVLECCHSSRRVEQLGASLVQTLGDVPPKCNTFEHECADWSSVVAIFLLYSQLI